MEVIEMVTFLVVFVVVGNGGVIICCYCLWLICVNWSSAR